MEEPPITSIDLANLLPLITSVRLTSYFVACRGDRVAAFALYEWNIEASGAAVSLAAMVEVVLRNALDAQLNAWASAQQVPDWLDHAPLDQRGLDDIRQAKVRAARGRRAATHGHVVAELNLGFWRYLMAQRYLTSLWILHLHRAFPFLRGDARSVRRTLESDVERLLFLRNRAAHHEPIHQRDLMDDLRRIKRLTGAVHPAAQAWIASREKLSLLDAKRPAGPAHRGKTFSS